jgi:branched-chain amino acid transport system permease protein
MDTKRRSLILSNLPLLILVVVLIALPFIIGIFTGQPFSEIFANEPGRSKDIQGKMIEVFILAVFAISYDLLLGITGLISFGHAMFFALPAYMAGVALKTFGWSFPLTVVAIVVVGIIQALLFGVVLPRVKGITFALVTLGLASVFEIVIQTRELADYTGGDVGLQGVPRPEFLNPNTGRLTIYFVVLGFTLLVYLLFRRFVDSPTGRACIALRENEDRAKMLGFNTFHFKLIALMVSGVAAGLAGMFHTIYKPIVSPEVAGLGFTVEGLLMILIGGIGTLSGPMIGAGTLFFLEEILRDFGELSNFILGAVFVALVMFVPYGIVGTWQQRSFRIKEGRDRLLKMITGRSEEASVEN